MNKKILLQSIANSVNNKHPWKISQEKYKNLFGELPEQFLEERQFYDTLLAKLSSFKLCSINLSEVRVEVTLTLHELIVWELNLDKWIDDVKAHNILPGDIKKLL